MVHPWHDVPIGDDAPRKVRAVVEVPRDTTTKYELDKELGLIGINRILYPPVPYPANYGFIPQTLDDDGDPLDTLVVMQNSVAPLTLLQARPIGVVQLIDRGETDDKVICVHVDDPRYEHHHEFDDLPKHEQETLRWFFNDYQDIMHRTINVEGFFGVKRAHEVIERCRLSYQETFGD